MPKVKGRKKAGKDMKEASSKESKMLVSAKKMHLGDQSRLLTLIRLPLG